MYVLVTDQHKNAVPGANVSVRLLWPQGEIAVDPIGTDGDGIAVFEPNVYSLPAGTTISVKVSATYQNHQRDTATAFLIWW